MTVVAAPTEQMGSPPVLGVPVPLAELVGTLALLPQTLPTATLTHMFSKRTAAPAGRVAKEGTAA